MRDSKPPLTDALTVTVMPFESEFMKLKDVKAGELFHHNSWLYVLADFLTTQQAYFLTGIPCSVVGTRVQGVCHFYSVPVDLISLDPQTEVDRLIPIHAEL